MDFTNLLNKTSKKSKLGIIGATKGFGYTLLVQLTTVEKIDLKVVSSRNAKECYSVLEEIGYNMNKVVVCKTERQIQEADKDAIIIVEDYRLVLVCNITSLVEATGDTKVSADAATKALNLGINVYMVSKETDSICGPYLNQLAIENNVIYSLVNGDQPRNLIDLYSRARLLGLEIIVAGKSSEYDFVWDRETGELTYTDGSNEYEHIPEMINLWNYDGRKTLEERKKLLKKYTKIISADLCEMNLVSNITGFIPSTPSLNYPIARTSELADIFIPEEDGGILKQKEVVDVFYQLRETNEASFAGGIFLIIKCKNKKMWALLESKGHIVSSNGDYACIYLPYHLMGLETPISILLGDFLDIGNQENCRQVSVMAGIAKEDLSKGKVLYVSGHHHEIEELTPQLLERDEFNRVAPFYLLNGCELIKDVIKGNLITIDDIDLSKSSLYELYKKGIKL